MAPIKQVAFLSVLVLKTIKKGWLPVCPAPSSCQHPPPNLCILPPGIGTEAAAPRFFRICKLRRITVSQQMLSER